MRIPPTRSRALALALTLAAALLVPASAHAAPTATFNAFVENTGTQYQHSDGDVHWINPSFSGNFSVVIDASDASGINRVEFPALGGPSWGPAGGIDPNGASPPYELSYSWTPGADASGVVNAVAWSVAGESTSVAFEVRTDSNAPIPGSITVPNVVTNAPSISMPFVVPTDAGSGIRSYHVQRRSTLLAGGACNVSWSGWSNVSAADPASPFVDGTIADGFCYEYRIRAVDNVNNPGDTPSASIVKVDRAVPVGTIDAAPAGPVVTTETITGTAFDTVSGVSHVDLRYVAPSSGDICQGQVPVLGAWSCIWDPSALAPGLYTLEATVTDVAGNVSVATRTIVVVEVPPGVTVTQSGSTVAEDGSGATLEVVLDTQPASDVAVTLTPDAQVATDVSTMTFTPADWDEPQVATISAIDDAVDEADPHPAVVEMATASADALYDGLVLADRVFDVQDNDLAAVLVDDGDGVVVVEGGASDTFAVALATVPTADVVVTLVHDAQIVTSETTLTFTPASWNVSQDVTVTAVDDADDEPLSVPSPIGVVVTSADPKYDALVVADLVVDVIDDEFTGAATASFGSFTEGAGAQYQHAVGSRIWFNPSRAGSFEVSADGTGSPSLASITFPMLGAGWTPASNTVDTSSPYRVAYAWSAGAVEPDAQVVTAMSVGDATATAAFTVTADQTPPTGATIAAQSTVTRDTSAPVSGTTGSDAGSGIGGWRFERRAASLAADTCGAFGAWAQIGPANVAGPTYSDASLPDATCLEYRLVVIDNVGNESSATQVGELKVDRTAPTASIDAPTRALYDTVTISGTARDDVTRLKSVSVMVEDRYSICGNAPVDANGRWTCEWTIGLRELGPATLKVTATDAAGHRTSASRDVTMVKPPSPFGPREEDIDRTPPVVGLARMPLISWTEGVKVKASAFDERPGTIEIRVEQQSAAASSSRFSPWTPSFEESEITALEDHGETYCFRGVAIDEAGNKATSDPRCTTLPLDDLDLAATGRWENITSRGAYLGSIRRSTTPRSALIAKVADVTPGIVVTKCRRCGTIRVVHGRRVVGTYSLASKVTRMRQVIQLPALRKPASAPLKIVVVNRKPVMIDGVVTVR